MAATTGCHVFFSKLQLQSSLTSSNPAVHRTAKLHLLAATAGQTEKQGSRAVEEEEAQPS
jgi:hypothetical protein